MDWQGVVNAIDDFVFQKTGEHLDSLQLAILKGVFDGQKYSAIAEQYGCSTGHAKDKGYELWWLLSEVFEEEVNKSNLVATVERLGFVNYQSLFIGNNVRVDTINLCSNYETAKLENQDNVHPGSNSKNIINENVNFRCLFSILVLIRQAFDKSLSCYLGINNNFLKLCFR